LVADDEDIDVIGLCKNGVEAIDMINSHEIDLMFLDIQMPVVSGFEVINSISKERIPHIIFVTAYDQYALKAFEVHAIDYILKPFTDQRFRNAIQRAKQMILQQKLQEEQKRLKSISEELADKNAEDVSLFESNKDRQRLIVKQSGKVQFVPINEIIWLEAYDYYVKIHVKDKFYLVRESLKKLSDKLHVPTFIRIHKSSIVNTNHILSISNVEHGEFQILLSNQVKTKIGRSYTENVKSIIDHLK
jgi:two-component system LytT family response regulator